MPEGRVQVDMVPVAPSVLLHVEHAGAAQVSYEAPNRSRGQAETVGDLLDIVDAGLAAM
jgi:hypothetical protein